MPCEIRHEREPADHRRSRPRIPLAWVISADELGIAAKDAPAAVFPRPGDVDVDVHADVRELESWRKLRLPREQALTLTRRTITTKPMGMVPPVGSASQPQGASGMPFLNAAPLGESLHRIQIARVFDEIGQ